ncbi:KRAB-A domain-containing protein 2-like [Macrobrachium nipponense]|uniref:KRAB-A domain-containing protein 2-like n=1 Tax=Macrobrachium nipponense TaxID=159736 RepID=UPI0030C8CD67
MAESYHSSSVGSFYRQDEESDNCVSDIEDSESDSISVNSGHNSDSDYSENEVDQGVSASIASFGETETIKKKNGKYMATKESVTGIIQQAHINTGHGGEKKTYKEVCEHYGNIPRSIVPLYIVHCEHCVEKRHRKETAAGVVVRPLSVRDLSERGQVDLVDMQTMKDGSYRFILHYMEYLTKFHVIRPLKSKTAAEVANELLFIFLDIGAPHILQSDNGREFTAEVIQELASLWPELILVNGRPRHPQSQGSIERGNGDMKLKLMAWIKDNNCAKWSYGVRFVQWAINSSYHEAIKMTPSQALTTEELERLIEVPLTGDSARDDLISVDPECEREPHPVADSQQQPAMEQENISIKVLHPAKQARKEAEYGLQKQAQRMLARSTRSMRAVEVGDNVSVPVSQFNRSKGEPP